jgi:hypothetical protein
MDKVGLIGGEKMKFFMAALISALLAAQVVPARSQRAGVRSNIPAKEYAIYAAVIGDMLANGELSPDPQLEVELLVIAGQTVKNHQAAIVGQDEGKILKQEFSSIISQETIDDYVAKNAKSYQLTKSFNLKLEYVLIPKEESDLSNLVGSIALSRVGFDSSSNQALVYIRDYCGPLCGGGNYMLLVKNRQGWIVKKRVNSWVS